VRFGKSDKIQFISTVEGLESIEECLPRPAKYFIPDWFKDIPSENSMSVKFCPSFPDYFSQGYIIPMWADVMLKYDKKQDYFEWQGSDDIFKWETHGNNQFLNYSKPNFNGTDAQFVFKSNCPWKIITPPGWSVLQLPLFYNFNQEWSVLPGIIDTDIHPGINQQVLYHGDGKEVKINVGDPFVLYIPFKRSNKLKLEVRDETKKDKKRFKTDQLYMNNAFRPNGKYRKMQRLRDKDVK
jgi:hypothetical protein